MSQENTEVFATGIGCIDGRERRAVDRYMEERGMFVDVATRAGMDKYCLLESEDVWEQIKEDVLVSVQKHNSKTIVISGHDECAGNPVSREEHFKCIARGIQIVESWNLGLDMEYIGLWVTKFNGEWTAMQIKEAEIQDRIEKVAA